MSKITESPKVRLKDALAALQKRVYMLEEMLTKTSYENKASKKQRFRRKRQTAVYNGLTRAFCVETIDPWKQNRVRFYHPILHDPKAKILSYPFASPVSAMGGFDDCGLNWVPPAGSTLIVFFENGIRDAPFYIGTTWHRDRGPGGKNLPVATREWEKVWNGHRKGYISGPKGDPNDESQVLPPWNTESYNSRDLNDYVYFTHDPLERRRITFPNIYGFKTPEKHMLKMVDGDAKCNRRWKRIEILSGGGNWMMFKDDHLHYGGQWAHPSCSPVLSSDSKCVDWDWQEYDEKGNLVYSVEKWCKEATPPKQNSGVGQCADSFVGRPYYSDIMGKPVEEPFCEPKCRPAGPTQCSLNALEDSQQTDVVDEYGNEIAYYTKYDFKGTPTPGKPPYPPTEKWREFYEGKNPYFKHQNECRPYHGPKTPQNNRCSLPQTGIQFLSISGHTIVLDDSVEHPRGKPEWERSLQPFDYGCNNKYMGIFYMKSSTGHQITMSDIEKDVRMRGEQNYIEMRTGNGIYIQLNDHTVRNHAASKDPYADPGQSCPPDYAGRNRGIHMVTTSNHKIKMIDHLNEQCGPPRAEGGTPISKAKRGYIQIQSGYGLEMRFNDDFSQEQTQSQWIQILHPQCVGEADSKCNSCESPECRGPHIMRFQGRSKGRPGVVYLRAGGHSLRQTYDMDIVIVGDKEKNPSDKFTYVSKKCIYAVEDVHFRYSGELHIFFAEKQILLMAGRDCPPPPGKKCKGPCLYNVIVARCPIICPLTGIIHWTEKAMSERVFASAYHPCQVPCGGGGCDGYAQTMATAGGKGCKEDESEEDIDLDLTSVPTTTLQE